MADFTLKQGDTWPPLQATLSDENGPLNLTGATVSLDLKATNGGAVLALAGSTTILAPATNGAVSYQWAVGDTATVGTYSGEFEITWPNGTVTTVPSATYFTVTIVPNLD
jgi:DUF4097 and DUF4098 domain-containing protein YvlB